MIITKEQPRTIGEVSIDSKLVYGRIKALQEGDIVTYTELSEIIGRNIIAHRHILQTARNMAQRNDNIVCDCVSKIGIKRLSNSEIVNITTTRPFSRIRSAVRNAAKQMNCIDSNKIDNNELVKINAARSVYGALSEMSRPKSIEDIAKSNNEPLPIGKTLQFFQNN